MLPFLTSAQTIVTGSVKNKHGEPLAVNVLVQEKGGVTISGFTTTNAEGNYTLTCKETADSISITVLGMNIGRHSKTVANRSGRVDFEIEEKPLEINEVSIIATKIKQVGDTVNYSVAAFKDQSDRVIGDVLKKLPGISVSPLGGISYMGSSINKFYIEGMDMLQGRYGIAVNNISAEDVATVQVLENHQPVRALRNRVFSDKAAINIKLKESAKGTFSVSGVAGTGYKPLMWNAELVSMYFARTMQNMNAYKINNSGIDISAEFRRHYDYERVYFGSESPLYIQSPGAPPIPQKRFLYNNAHTLTVNQLAKINENSEITANALYYHDRIKKTGFSRYEQYLPGDSVFVIEEQIGTLSKIHNLEFALRFNTNAENYYLTNAFNIRSGWNSDTGTGLTQSNAGNLDKTLSQWLDKPFFGIDNTVNLIKNTKNGCDCKIMLFSMSIYLIPKLFPDSITFVEAS